MTNTLPFLQHVGRRESQVQRERPESELGPDLHRRLLQLRGQLLDGAHCRYGRHRHGIRGRPNSSRIPLNLPLFLD